jgi:hypothetical protein
LIFNPLKSGFSIDDPLGATTSKAVPADLHHLISLLANSGTKTRNKTNQTASHFKINLCN